MTESEPVDKSMDGGWELLIDGNSLDNWKIFNGGEVTDWKIEDGILHNSGANKDIITKKAQSSIKEKRDNTVIHVKKP